MSKIRVGLINCDLHGMYYSALMAKHDPIALRDDKSGRGHAAYFYFYTYYNDPRILMVPKVSGFKLAKVWDADREIAETIARIWSYDNPLVCDKIQDVSDDVDLIFIADCNGDGSDHLKLARPGIMKGVPTFIDKPLAYDVKDAKAIMALGKKHSAPVMSLSMLKEVPQAGQFAGRLKEVGSLEFGTVKGGGDHMAGHIHAISLAQRVFGSGVESVECMGPTPLAHMYLDYGGKAGRPVRGVVLNCGIGLTDHCAFYTSAYGSEGAIHSPGIGDFVFPFGAVNILKKIKKMVATGKTQAPIKEMVENIAVATAARLAQAEGRRVYLKEVWK